MKPLALFMTAMGLPLVLESFDRFVQRYAVNAEMYCPLPKHRTIQWGRMARLERAVRVTEGEGWNRKARWIHEPQFVSYFHLRLPSWQWREVGSDYGRGPACWAQLLLVWTSERGWFLWHEPVES